MTGNNLPETYSHLEMEAALCVWECLNQWDAAAPLGKPGLDAEPHVHSAYALRFLWEEAGSVAMRHLSIRLGQWCLKVYDMADGAETFDGMAYDWEVIPAMLTFIKWPKLRDMVRYGSYIASDLPDVLDVAANMRMLAANFAGDM